MPQKFELTLCNYPLYFWLALTGFMTALMFSLKVFELLPQSWGFGGVLLIAAPTMYGAYRLLRQLPLRQALVLVEPGGLLVRYLRTGREITINFADVQSYRDERLNDGRELRFRLRSGRKIKLVVNDFLGPTGDYYGLL